MANLKISGLLLFAMVALHCGKSDSMDSIEGNCNDDIRLPCKATDRTKKYRYIMWYKTERVPVIKKKNGEYTYYNFTSVSLGEKGALELSNVQPSTSGVYKCYLAADVGGQNDESYISLNISECLDVSTPNTVYSTAMPPSVAIPTESCSALEELTVSWAVLGLFLFSICKIILCIVTVVVCDRVFSMTRRKQGVSGSKAGTSSSWKD
ncbi:uncharacterized protein [Pseudorasbora parva]|uniref:uncharacterized protein n=1 Tax=Pseudorasbora parva TaxID=51549 RepID=UPI00351EAE8B